jgi:hypothetical protein
MSNYTTLDLCKSELKADSTVDDSLLFRYIIQASQRVDLTMGTPRRPYFAPYTEQRTYPIEATRISSRYWENTFNLRDHILAFTEVLRQTTDITSQVALYTWSNEVATALRLTNCSYDWYTGCSSTQPYKIYVTGTWGYHPDYSNAFDSVDTVQDNPLTAAATSITVSDADGADLWGFTPRFSPGNLIKIEDELIDVTAVNTTTNVLTVRRGRNGTTAAAHAQDTAISVYQVDERIQRAVTRQATLLYARRGAYQVETLDGVGVITYPQDLLTELKQTLMEFQYA